MTAPATDGAAILTRGLTRRFGKKTAVDGLDLEVSTGQIFGFLGPNGAGKTTTIRMLTAIQPLSYILPMTYFLEIIRGIMIKGIGFADLTVPFSALRPESVSPARPAERRACFERASPSKTAPSPPHWRLGAAVVSRSAPHILEYEKALLMAAAVWYESGF